MWELGRRNKNLRQRRGMMQNAFFYRESQGKGASAGDSVTAGSPADLMMAAHEIARDHFDYESGDANIVALKYLLRYLKDEKLPFLLRPRPIAEHFLTDLVR